MYIYSIIICGIFLFIFFTFYIKFKIKNKNNMSKKLAIYRWMKMERKKRFMMDEKDRLNVLERRRQLISRTRKEYLKYKKSIYN